MAKSVVARRVAEVAALVGLTDHLTKYPDQLSGGQRQRVALGRAIIREPVAFLMDEPLSNLDALLRVQMRSELLKLHRRVGRTTIYVTHDQIEAMTMADRIVVLRDGVVQQVGTTDEVYNHPANTFVAIFVGSPPMNLIAGRLMGDAGNRRFVGPFAVDLDGLGPIDGCRRGGHARDQAGERRPDRAGRPGGDPGLRRADRGGWVRLVPVGRGGRRGVGDSAGAGR